MLLSMLSVVVTPMARFPGFRADRLRQRRVARRRRRRLEVESLEARVLLDAAGAVEFSVVLPASVERYIVAGAADDGPAASAPSHVDDNTASSPFAGVGSLFLTRGGGLGYLGSATPIAAQYLLTAAHLLDIDDDGTIDFEADNVTFILNYGGNRTHTVAAAELYLHPNYHGFGKPTVNDDIAVVKLSAPLPAEVPVYALYAEEVAPGTVVTMVGYGRAGDGVQGFTSGASFSVKRSGQNAVDAFVVDDEGSGAREVFLFDFDGPTGSGFLGGPTLGDDVEATLGPGDSGSPSFVEAAGTYHVAGVNTFGLQAGRDAPAPPLFGSGGGGILVHPYRDWIDDIRGGGGTALTGSTENGNDEDDNDDGEPGTPGPADDEPIFVANFAEVPSVILTPSTPELPTLFFVLPQEIVPLPPPVPVAVVVPDASPPLLPSLASGRAMTLAEYEPGQPVVVESRWQSPAWPAQRLRLQGPAEDRQRPWGPPARTSGSAEKIVVPRAVSGAMLQPAADVEGRRLAREPAHLPATPLSPADAPRSLSLSDAAALAALAIVLSGGYSGIHPRKPDDAC